MFSFHYNNTLILHTMNTTTFQHAEAIKQLLFSKISTYLDKEGITVSTSSLNDNISFTRDELSQIITPTTKPTPKTTKKLTPKSTTKIKLNVKKQILQIHQILQKNKLNLNLNLNLKLQLNLNLNLTLHRLH